MKNASYYREIKNSRVYYNNILEKFEDALDKAVYDHAYDMFANGPVVYHSYLKDIETPDGSVEYLVSTYNIIMDDIVNILKKKLKDYGYTNIKINYENNNKPAIRIEFDY